MRLRVGLKTLDYFMSLLSRVTSKRKNKSVFLLYCQGQVQHTHMLRHTFKLCTFLIACKYNVRLLAIVN